MSTVNVQKFIKELADYINNFIVGTETTAIVRCEAADMPMNRGHAIPIHLKVPAGMEGAELAPCYYAEELIAQNPGSTVAAIAEKVNAELSASYEDFARLGRIQAEASKKTLADCSLDDIILTANITGTEEAPGEPFARKEMPELGLTVAIKAEIYTDEVKGQTYYSPVAVPEGQEPSKEQWERAKLNSLTMSDIGVLMAPVEEDGKMIPVCGEICDMKGFFDYFYLLGAEQIWKKLLDDTGAQKLYIFPQGAYNARFVFWGGALEGSDTAKALRSVFMESAVESMDTLRAAYVVDRKTMEIRRLEDKK